jgi:15,16-dihydrobiliverdin:ferredoxin oxidoreductase
MFAFTRSFIKSALVSLVFLLGDDIITTPSNRCGSACSFVILPPLVGPAALVTPSSIQLSLPSSSQKALKSLRKHSSRTRIPFNFRYRVDDNDESLVQSNVNNTAFDHPNATPTSYNRQEQEQEFLQKNTREGIDMEISGKEDFQIHRNHIDAMPWKSSISQSYSNHNGTLPFMPYYTFTKSILSTKLQNVQQYQYDDEKYHYYQIKNDQRIINECFQSDEFRKIRMTYYDGGNKIQVFNSLWYPHYNLGNLPLLGIDLICFGGRKCLVVVDFQPMTPLNEETHVDSNKEDIMLLDGNSDDHKCHHHLDWESDLKMVWDDLPPILKQKMSKRFYDEHQFFSKYMIFGRFDIEDEDNIYGSSILDQGGELWSAFEKYVSLYLNVVHSRCHHNRQLKDDKETTITPDLIMESQRQYDQYSAERDPAKPMFCKVFGDEWGNGYIHDFLFELSSEDKS